MVLDSHSSGRRQEELLPLINVAFLLLIFFMLAGSLEPAALLPLEPPHSRSATAVARLETVVQVAADGRIAVDGREVDREGLREVLAERLRTGPARGVRLAADGRLDARELVSVMRIMHQAGVRSALLLALPAAP